MLLAGCSGIINPLLEKSDQALDESSVDQLEVEINQELMLDGEEVDVSSPTSKPDDGSPSPVPSGGNSTSGSGSTDYKSLELEAGAMILESEPPD